MYTMYLACLITYLCLQGHTRHSHARPAEAAACQGVFFDGHDQLAKLVSSHRCYWLQNMQLPSQYNCCGQQQCLFKAAISWLPANQQ
jgi:hypothetical protein